MDISILIVSYNTANYLRKCLDSILRSKSGYTFEIIVTDNNSSDCTHSLLSEYPNVKWIINKYNYGFATAMNQAYRASAGKYVMSFNPDAEVFEDTLQQAVAYLEANTIVGKVGLATMQRGTLNLPHSEFRKFELPHLVRMFQKPKSVYQTEAFRVDWIFGTGMVVRRSILAPDRLYDETSFLFWEEFGLSQFVRNAGYEMHILPHVRILHHTSVTLKLPDEDRIYWARLLSLSHQWRIRKDYYGRLNALINLLIGAADNLILYGALSIKSWFSASDPVRELERLDRKVQARAHLQLLLSGERTIRQVNERAVLFFNQGSMPVYPPVTVS